MRNRQKDIPKYKGEIVPINKYFDDGSLCETTYDIFENPFYPVKDMFNNDVKIGDYIVSTSSLDGIHSASIGWPCKVIGFRRVVYWYGLVEYYALCARRYPLTDRGKPFVENLKYSMKTTLHNYIVCQKRMIASDRDDRINPTEYTPEYINETTTNADRYGCAEWQRPFVKVTYEKNGVSYNSVPHTRKRKARKSNRFFMTDAAKECFDENGNLLPDANKVEPNKKYCKNGGYITWR